MSGFYLLIPMINHQKKQPSCLQFQNRFTSIFIAGCLAIIGVFSTTKDAEAAQAVVLKYGMLRESISVSELSTFAKTGQLSSSLRAYLSMANQKPEKLRQVLTEEIEVNPTSLSQVLNSFPGEIVLDLVSEVIQTPSGKASRQSLRGALVTSALSDGKINLIEVLENYPTSEVHIDGERLVETYNSINKVVGQLPDIGL